MAPSRTRERSTRWWLETLERRARQTDRNETGFAPAIEWTSADEQRAAVRFFNAAFRAEESGLRQAHELAGEVQSWDPELGEVLRLYGNEEGWHRELLAGFLSFIGGSVRPMGRVTRLFYGLYARARRMETIVLTNLMFETIGAATYRLALGRVRHEAARQMLTILTRDESFHVPLNAHFLRRVLERTPEARPRLRRLYRLLFLSLLLLPFASRPKARAFDGISTGTLLRTYARELARLFARESELGLDPPWLVLRALGITRPELVGTEDTVTSHEAAERAADRSQVRVSAL